MLGVSLMRVHNFVRDRRGNIAIVFAAVVPVLISAVAMAVDVTNLLSAQASLRNALDSALLAASHLKDSPASRDATFQSYLAANVFGKNELTNVQGILTVEQTAISIKTTARATADVRLYFRVFGVSKRVAAEASAYESSDDLEVVLALDNTGSMAGARIAALRTAAASLIDILENVRSTTREVRVALVPFVTAVNVKGEGFDMDWIDQEGRAPLNGANFANKADHLGMFAKLGVNWKGCVEARPAPYNVSDEPPSYARPETLFVPYFAPDEPGIARAPSSGYGNSPTGYNNSYLDDMGGGPDMNMIASPGKYSSSTRKIISEAPPLTIGPNRACPTPIVPLTNDFAKLRTAAAAMREWNGSGTNVSEGLAWGMRVLSPAKPYSQGKPFKAHGVTKVVVLLTDGENVVYGASNMPTRSDYGSYGFLASNRFGSLNQTTAARNVDGWVRTLCDTLKGQGVQIYTVLLEADTAANRSLYTACASSASNYYPTNDVSQLDSVFRSIGSAIARLQLTQ